MDLCPAPALVSMQTSIDRPLLAVEPAQPVQRPDAREVFVPFEDLNVILEGQPRRVLLSREEYQQLKSAAKAEAQARPPHEAVILAADYQVDVQSGRAVISGVLVLEALTPGVRAIRLDLAGVGFAPSHSGQGQRPDRSHR